MNKIFFFIFIIIQYNNILADEVKIIYTIDNEIITNQDVIEEFRYLSVINKQINKLNKEKILNIAKSSIIREKVKKIEIEKNFNLIELDKDIEITLVQNLYQRLGYKNIEEFQAYLNLNNIEYSYLVDKIAIEALWNKLITQKYSSLISLDLQKYKKELLKKKSQKSKDYLLSEIVFEVKEKNNTDSKIKEIVKYINDFSFENAASTYSISNTSNIGGKLDWINEKSMDNKIIDEIKKIKKGNFTKPIKIPSGYLLLKINDIKEQLDSFDLEVELNKRINYEQNKQLDQFSKIYFNKVRTKLDINED